MKLALSLPGYFTSGNYQHSNMGGNIALKYQHENMRTEKKNYMIPNDVHFLKVSAIIFPLITPPFRVSWAGHLKQIPDDMGIKNYYVDESTMFSIVFLNLWDEHP